MENKDRVLSLLVAGSVPALALTVNTSVALALSCVVLFTSICSTLVLSLLRKSISDTIRIPMIIIINTFFVSISLMLLASFFPKTYTLGGVYFGLCALSLMLFKVGESASEKETGVSLKESITVALIYCVVVIVTALIREIFGSASIFGYSLSFLSSYTIPILSKASGAFIIYAFVLAAFSALKKEAK